MLQNILLLQETVQSAPGSAQVTEEKLSILSLLLTGGWIMIPLAAFAVVVIYLFFERYFSITKASKDDPRLLEAIKIAIKEGDIDKAKELGSKANTPVSRMIEKGVSRIGNPLREISASIENVGNLEIYRLEKGLATLATISGAAPMIGFLGTVTGMIKAFFELANSGNNTSPSDLAGGIYEALVTTAFGLAIGIVAYVGYNYLTSMIEKLVFRMEATSLEFIDILQEPA
ncbi:MAG: MotA/TolQ/ExbB proton channel family protein [Bacteroidetes bacterium]|nr:MotA/TolQ/ExbB proton channel family protein [Bacteroidota bacterium]